MTYYLSVAEHVLENTLIITDEDIRDFDKSMEYKRLIESYCILCSHITSMYHIPNEELPFFRKYAIVVENKEITSKPNYKEIIPFHYFYEPNFNKSDTIHVHDENAYDEDYED